MNLVAARNARTIFRTSDGGSTMKSSQKRLLLLTGIVALAFVGPINTPAANAVTIIVDEEGHGFKFDENGGRLPDLSFSLSNDPGPGGLNFVLTYSLGASFG